MMTTNDEILALARRRFEEGDEAESLNRERALDDLRMLEGGDKQWPKEVRDQRIRNHRPMITVNKLPGFVDQIVGDMLRSKMSIQVLPVDDKSDLTNAKHRERLIRNIEYVSNAKRIYSLAGESAVQCGYGAWQVLTRYENNDSFNQEIYLKYIRNPFMMTLDPNSEMPDGSDMKWGFISEVVSREDFERQWPDKPFLSFEESDTVGSGLEKWWMDSEARIADYYWIDDEETKKLLLLSSGDAVYKDALEDHLLEYAINLANNGLLDPKVPPPADQSELMSFLGLEEIDSRDVPIKKVMHCKMSGSQILDGPEKLTGEYIPLIPVYGKELIVDGEIIRRGVIRHAKQPQQMYNYHRTANIELLGLQHKAPYIGTDKNFQNHPEWDSANTGNHQRLVFTADINNPRGPYRENPPQGSMGLAQEAMAANDDMKATTGIYDASLGRADNATSGKAIRERKMEGDTANFAYHDNLAASVEHCGRVIVSMMPGIYDTQRWVRTLGDEKGDQSNILINEVDQMGEPVKGSIDMTNGSYDVRVEVGPSVTTQRQESQEFMKDLMPNLPEPMRAELIPKLIRHSEVHESEEIADKLEKVKEMMFPSQQQEPSPTGGMNPGEQPPKQ